MTDNVRSTVEKPARKINIGVISLLITSVSTLIFITSTFGMGFLMDFIWLIWFIWFVTILLGLIVSRIGMIRKNRMSKICFWINLVLAIFWVGVTLVWMWWYSRY